MNYLERITIDPKVMHGKPSIRNMRFTEALQLLELIAGGMSFQEILDEDPYLEKEGIQACLNYAVKIAGTKQILAIA